MSMQIKEAIIKLETPNRAMREIGKTLRVAKSTIWCIERPQKTSKVHDCRTISP